MKRNKYIVIAILIISISLVPLGVFNIIGDGDTTSGICMLVFGFFLGLEDWIALIKKN